MRARKRLRLRHAVLLSLTQLPAGRVAHCTSAASLHPLNTPPLMNELPGPIPRSQVPTSGLPSKALSASLLRREPVAGQPLATAAASSSNLASRLVAAQTSLPVQRMASTGLAPSQESETVLTPVPARSTAALTSLT